MRLFSLFDCAGGGEMNRMGGRLREHEEWLAGKDHLTGLWGLHQFAERAHKALKAMPPEEAAETVIVFLNLHHFRRYNRRYGYEEGDVVLRRFARALQANSSIGLPGRIAEDHFLFLVKQDQVEEILKELNHRLQEISCDNILSIRAGIYDIDPSDSVIAAGDKAKTAADSLRGKSIGETFWHYYDHELEVAMERRSYILENLDQAIQSGWIHVYYQPVMRTLTGKLCGMEALARWEDPTYGLMPPSLFIHVLEENMLIHKLDLQIVRLVCEDYRREKNAGHPFVPVSFNLSRLDFDLCDILSEVDKITREYEVPKETIHVEITESMLADNDNHVRRTMEQFHESGYQVWMDDFGSGYSTLNVLKDYQFDEIKIDMRFLSDSGERSRKIITSVVDMAKKIGIQTLAEGVENQQQLNFLRGIGCEKIQGYYYGKPQRFEEGVGQILQQKEKVEDEILGHYYDEIGKVNLIDERNIALAEYDGKNFRIPYINDKLREVLGKLRIDSNFLLEERCNDPIFPDYEEMRSGAGQLFAGSGRRSTSFVSDGRYFLLTASCIGEMPGKKMLQVCVSDMTENQEMNHEVEMDEAIRSLYLTCENIYINNPDQGKTHSLLAKAENPKEEENWKHTIDPEGYARDCIYPGDQRRYLEFADPKTLYTRMLNSPRRFISGYFRTKEHTGQYRWKRHLFILISKRGRREYVSAVQSVLEKELLDNMDAIWRSRQQEVPGSTAETVEKRAERFAETLPASLSGDDRLVTANAEFASPEDFWRNLLVGSAIKLCWKDESRRYLGASQSFLDYFGLSSASELFGKMDEEFGWHIAGAEYRKQEERILTKGGSLLLQPQKCLVKGVLRDVLTNKQPLYRDGRIIGIFSYFIDVTDWESDVDPARESMDVLSGALNIRGIMQASEKFRRAYEEEKQNFGYIYLDIHEYNVFRDKYGKELGERLLHRIADDIKEAAGANCAVGRIWLDNFIVICQAEKLEGLEAEIEKIRQKLWTIRRIEEIPVTVYVSAGAGLYSETETLEQCMMLARNRMKEVRGALFCTKQKGSFD